MIIFTRQIDLSQWTMGDSEKPCYGEKVYICDADRRGYADYELEATFNGDDFILDGFGVVYGATYWKKPCMI